ncbi:MAG TPA: GDSL-type esterase/lipase family protein [Nitrospira sp.]|nr:GDSL-type esterase/lipase family protein [Nitrospira sp.]
MNQPLPVRVICFGDSLTAGFQSPTRENPQGRSTPYGDWVQEMIGAAGEVRTSGICGELTGEMLVRFRRDVLAHQPHYVVILGGTNDLGWNGSPGEIMRNLAKMYEQTLAAGGVPVPVTVPSLRVEDATGSREGWEWVAGHLARRFELNTLIGEYARTKGVPAIDLFAATAESDTNLLAREYSNDGLHLSTAGYRLFADLVYRQVLQPALSNKS